MWLRNLAIFVIFVGVVVFILYFIENGIPVVLLPPDMQKQHQQEQQVDPPKPPVNPIPPGPPQPNVVEPLKPTFIQAQQQNKKVFLMLTMDNCLPCARMKRHVFPYVDMSAYVYMETKNKTVVDEYHATSFPTLILFDNTGKELKRHVGFLNMHELHAWIN